MIIFTFQLNGSAEFEYFTVVCYRVKIFEKIRKFPLKSFDVQGQAKRVHEKLRDNGLIAQCSAV